MLKSHPRLKLNRILITLIVIGVLSCHQKVNVQDVIGFYYTNSSDAYVIKDFQEEGVYKMYNEHMGGKFEVYGNWNLIGNRVISCVDSLFGWYEIERYTDNCDTLYVSEDGDLVTYYGLRFNKIPHDSTFYLELESRITNWPKYR